MSTESSRNPTSLNHEVLNRRYGPGEGRVVAITGSTGLIGDALSRLLDAGGYRVLRISRGEASAAGWVHWDPARGRLDPESLEGIFGVVHLAGESIAGLRWTAGKRRRILESREQGTLLLSRTLAELDRPPEVLASASGIHYYGDRGDEILTEDSVAGDGFLAEVCRRWEASVEPARAAGIRTVIIRTGPVLSTNGGALAAMLRPFKLGVGGRIGSGLQYMPWIDISDLVGLYLHALRTVELGGPMIGAAPAPVRNAEFVERLAEALGRPAFLPVPAVAIRLALGEMGRELLLFGQRAHAERALSSGYEFLLPRLGDSLRHHLNDAG